MAFATGVAFLAVAGIVAWRHWPRPIHVGTVPVHPASHVVNLGRETNTQPPSLLRIPALGVTALIEPVVIAQGVLGAPDNPKVLGWWADGAVPGSQRGSAVIDGHVDSAASGPGALFQLRTLKPGDKVIVTEGQKTVEFEIAALREYPKADLSSAGVFDQTVPGRLVLITCGGRFDYHKHSYDDNVVAFAVPKPT